MKVSDYGRLAAVVSMAATVAGCGGSDGGTTVASDRTARTVLSAADVPGTVQSTDYRAGQSALLATENALANATDEVGRAKNIILFVGDGMGVSTVTAARILEGQLRGVDGESNQLSWDRFPFAALSKTYSANQQTPDSAPTATAMMTGVKTNDGVLGVGQATKRRDCASTFGNELVTALELAELAGKATGVVSTARITHATPASTYAKSVERDWEDDSDMPAEALAAGCKDIADQLVGFEKRLESRFPGVDVDGIDVVMGGGRRHFLPKDAAFNSGDEVSAVEGDRTDGRNLVAEWQTMYPAGRYVQNKAQFDALDGSVTKVFGLFNESHMQYHEDILKDRQGEPTLSEMTAKAIDVLAKNEKGYFMMVEAGRIDHGHHAGSAYSALTDTIELARAVQTAVDATKASDTLIIVTADHSHVFTIAGYPKRGNPILGKVVQPGATEPTLAADGMPYTTLGYTNGLGFADMGNETDADKRYDLAGDNRRVDLTLIDTTAAGFHQEALVPLSSETHAGEDVGIYARGPGAHLFSGTMEQHMIFHVMNRMGDLEGQANAALSRSVVQQ
ncbi:MAG: alkaline phosphatase [Burkholderiaceae bacterium]